MAGLISETFNHRIMKWFLARYIYQIVSGDDNYISQFDEQMRLINALNSNEALIKAEAMAEGFHPPFKNCKGEPVVWKFICIADLHEISAPDNGAEVASILHEPADAAGFLSEVEKRKAYLKQHMKLKTSETELF